MNIRTNHRHGERWGIVADDETNERLAQADRELPHGDMPLWEAVLMTVFAAGAVGAVVWFLATWGAA